MHEKEQWINAIRDNSSETIASIILADIERIEKQQQEIERLNKELEEKEAILGGIQQLEAEIERLKKDNEYLNKKHEKTIHNIMEFVDKNTFNHRNTGERILTLHGKGILDLLDICLGVDEE